MRYDYTSPDPTSDACFNSRLFNEYCDVRLAGHRCNTATAKYIAGRSTDDEPAFFGEQLCKTASGIYFVCGWGSPASHHAHIDADGTRQIGKWVYLLPDAAAELYVAKKWAEALEMATVKKDLSVGARRI